MGMLGTALDTKLEETAPHSSDGSFICRGFQPFVRPRVALTYLHRTSPQTSATEVLTKTQMDVLIASSPPKLKKKWSLLLIGQYAQLHDWEDT